MALSFEEIRKQYGRILPDLVELVGQALDDAAAALEAAGTAVKGDKGDPGDPGAPGADGVGDVVLVDLQAIVASVTTFAEMQTQVAAWKIAALTPTMAAATPGALSFTSQVTNYSADYTWAVAATNGTAEISGSGLITVTGLNAEQSSVVTVTTTRTGYSDGTGTVTGSASA